MEDKLVIGYEPIYVEVTSPDGTIDTYVSRYEPVYAEPLLVRFSQLNEVERRELLRSMSKWIA